MKKKDEDNRVIKTIDRAETYGYRVKEVVMQYATSWFVYVPGVKHFGYVDSVDKALLLCDDHLKKALA